MASNATRVSFATFSVEWSGNGNGKGWVYFSTGPTEFRKAADYVMCVTTETNLAAIDANGRRWNYRGRPGVNIRALLKSQVPERFLGKEKRASSVGSIAFVSLVAFIFGAVCGGGLLCWFGVRRIN